MFSFFKKKAPAADGALPSPEGQADRPKGALEWLNTDVGELFFGKKPSSDPAAAGTEDGIVVVPPLPIVGPSQGGTPSSPDLPADRSDWLAKLRSGLRRTGAGIADAFVAATIDDAMYENLETALLQADAGIAATQFLLDDLERRVTRAHIREPAAMRRLLADCIADLLAPLELPLRIGEHSPTVIMVVGVNGAGKTTSVGKLARHLIDANQKVMLAAADTFRAAARETTARVGRARRSRPRVCGWRHGRVPHRDRQPGRRRPGGGHLRRSRRRQGPRLRRRDSPTPPGAWQRRHTSWKS